MRTNLHSNTATLPDRTVAPDVSAKASQVKAAADSMADAVANEARHFGEIAKAWWQHNAGLVRDTAATVRDEAGAINERGQRYVRDEPVKSVLIAAAVGAAITVVVSLALKRNR